MESAREELIAHPPPKEPHAAMHRMHQAATAMRFLSVMKLRHLSRRRAREAQQARVSKPSLTMLGSFSHMLKYSRLNLLLLALPVALLAKPIGMSSAAVFLLNFVSIIPLAQLLGVATEEVAIYSNEVIGGLLNATLGNATGRPHSLGARLALSPPFSFALPPPPPAPRHDADRRLALARRPSLSAPAGTQR